MKEISVIVPAYNTEQYIEKCIKSILAQSYSDFKLYLVDDGSPDGCGEICDRYALNDERIVVIHKRNGGQSSARNFALSLCDEDYVYFCDSDDFVEPDLLKECYAQAVAGDYDQVRFDYDYYTDGKVNNSCLIKTEKEFVLNGGKALADFLINTLLNYKIGFEVCFALYKTQTAKEANCCFSEGIDYAEDMFFTVCHSLKCKKIRYLPKAEYHYLIHNESTLRRNNERCRLDDMVTLAYEVNKRCEDDYLKEHFYLLFFAMVEAEMKKLPKKKTKTAEYINKIKYKDFFTEQCCRFCEDKDKDVKLFFGTLGGAEKKAFVKKAVFAKRFEYDFIKFAVNVKNMFLRIINRIKN